MKLAIGGFKLNKNKQRRGIKSKENISKVAINLFTDRGYNNVSVDEIVKSSNTSKGAFYSHFESKADIFFNEFAKADIYYLNIYENLPHNLSSKGKIVLFVEKMMGYLEQLGKEMITIIYSTAITDHPNYFIKNDRKLYFIIHSLIHEGVENNEFAKDIQIHETTKYISRCFRASLYDWCLHHNDDYNLIEESVNIIGFLIDGIKK